MCTSLGTCIHEAKRLTEQQQNLLPGLAITSERLCHTCFSGLQEQYIGMGTRRRSHCNARGKY